MIGQLTGTVADASNSYLTLAVGGVGYRVRVTTQTFQTLRSEKASITLLTHLAVRENALDLYGFLDREELKFFELLLTVSGIGPKSAIAILSIADVSTISRAIGEGNSSYLTKVSGIGRKIAEKIVIELREKVESMETTETGATKDDTDVLEALQALGYKTLEAREALKKIPREGTASEKLKAALQLLGK